MYKLRQRKATATFRVLLYEETTGKNDFSNICLITCSGILRTKRQAMLHHTVTIFPRHAIRANSKLTTCNLRFRTSIKRRVLTGSFKILLIIGHVWISSREGQVSFH